jgi:hypothetical protein
MKGGQAGRPSCFDVAETVFPCVLVALGSWENCRIEDWKQGQRAT